MTDVILRSAMEVPRLPTLSFLVCSSPFSVSCLPSPPLDRLPDGSFRALAQHLPKDTIVVIEDIDSLFGRDRASTNSKSRPLSFSGLEGVGAASGQVPNDAVDRDEGLERGTEGWIALFLFAK